jgi:hypothetical protein
MLAVMLLAHNTQAWFCLHVMLYYIAISVLACVVVLRVQAAAGRLCVRCVDGADGAAVLPLPPVTARSRRCRYVYLYCVFVCFRGARCRGTCAVGCVRVASDCVVCD